MDEESRALEVGEKLVTEARAVGRAFDEPRDVGDGELSLLRPVHDSENGLERRERIVRHLRLRVRDAAQERRLARVREAGERGVHHELEPELQLELVPGQARLGEARRLPGGGREARVAASALAPARDDVAAVRRGQIADEAVVGVEQLRPHGHADLDVVTVGSVLLAPTAVSALARLDVLDPPVGGQVAKARVDEHDDVSSAAPVTTVGTALRNVLLAAEAQPAVAATARLGVDMRSVVEHRRRERAHGLDAPTLPTRPR